MAPLRTYPDELREQAAALRAQGLSYGQIAKRLRVPITTVKTWLLTSEQRATTAKNQRDRRRRNPRSQATGTCARCHWEILDTQPDSLCGFCREELQQANAA